MIGTMTFHWATNYGAVLQAYALQTWLLKSGYDTEIVNYVPCLEYIKDKLVNVRDRNLGELKKEKKLRLFRKKYLRMSQLVLKKNKLTNLSNRYSHLICGSDQIWNPYFTLHGDKGAPDLSYFLDFADHQVKKTAYAVSFGTTKVSPDYIAATKEEIRKFNAISVREKSGLDILSGFGTDSVVVCDPTVLLRKVDYQKIASNEADCHRRVFSYILHNDELCKRISTYVNGLAKEKTEGDMVDYSLECWLGCIANSDIIVTNSFHGIMLSIILNRPFIAVLIKNSGMNDRIATLLNKVGLENRMITDYDEKLIEKTCRTGIAWDIVNIKLDTMRGEGIAFLENSLRNGMKDEQ